MGKGSPRLDTAPHSRVARHGDGFPVTSHRRRLANQPSLGHAASGAYRGRWTESPVARLRAPGCHMAHAHDPVGGRTRHVVDLDLGRGAHRAGAPPLSHSSFRNGVTELTSRAADGRWSRALLVVSIAALVRVVFAALIPVFPDEAYYWLWSRDLAPGYFDHPAGIAYLIRFGDILSPFGIGATPFALRLGPVLSGWIASVATVAIANRIGGGRAAFRAAVVMSVMPLAAAGLVLATP